MAALYAMFVPYPGSENPLAPDDEDASECVEISPGQIVRLAPGEDVTVGQRADSGGTYEPFQYRTLLQISAALGIPYPYLANDMVKGNFSNSRLALIEFRRRVSAWQMCIRDREKRSEASATIPSSRSAASMICAAASGFLVLRGSGSVAWSMRMVVVAIMILPFQDWEVVAAVSALARRPASKAATSAERIAQTAVSWKSSRSRLRVSGVSRKRWRCLLYTSRCV